MARAMDWAREGNDWPNRSASRFVAAAGLTWHVQVFGIGPAVLLLHGTGASTHTWRDVAPELARHFTVIAPDLPGHGFTTAAAPARMSVAGMADGVAALLRALHVAPCLAVGHSAGAAVLARLALDGQIAPRVIVSLNGAFVPLGGALRWMSPAARLLALIPAVPRLVAARARRGGTVESLIASTGSTLDAVGEDLYARLLHDPAHIAGALAMMANWQLEATWAELPALVPPLCLVVGGNDRTVPPEQARTVAARVPGAQVEVLPGLGHLAHEERPAEVAALVLQHARAHGVRTELAA